MRPESGKGGGISYDLQIQRITRENNLARRHDFVFRRKQKAQLGGQTGKVGEKSQEMREVMFFQELNTIRL